MAAAPMLLSSGNTAQQLAAALRNAIEQNVFQTGDRLQTERELAQQYRLPRSAVRNALLELENQGLVDRKAGSGTYVRPQESAGHTLGMVADDITPVQLIDVRATIEPEVTRLAARHAALADIKRLEDILGSLEGAGNDVHSFNMWDERFHLALAQATRNPLMVWLYRQINDVRGRTRWMTVRDEKLTSQRIADYNRLHREILDAISQRDAEAAADAMRRHMIEARADFMG